MLLLEINFILSYLILSYSKILLCLTYVSQSLVVPSVLEDTPVFDVCIPVIGLLEDTPVFDVCIPVIGCTLCTRRCSCVWRMYPSHWLYPLYSKMLLCLTTVIGCTLCTSYPLYSKMLLCLTTVIGCTLCTLRYSCVWRMYPSHWLYPLYSKILLCLTYVGCPSHWLYPLYSKMLLCLTTVIGCTLCTLRYSCVWRMYPSHWLYPLYSKVVHAPVFDVCIPVIGCTLCTRRYSCVWRMYPSHWLYPLYSKMLMCWRQSLVV